MLGMYIDTCNDMYILVTGKKSPVYGKWKEFYIVIKYGEQKLLYHEREDVSFPLMMICIVQVK